MTALGINLRNLDALRGVLAVYVAIGHCRWLLWGGHAAWLASAYQPWEVVPAYSSALFRYGREAVMVFFVLSGFFIHFRAASPRARAAAPPPPAAFYRRRWHRLAAPYFFALGVTVVCDAIGRWWWPTLYGAATGDALLDLTFSNGGYTPAAVVPALVLLPTSLGRDFGSNGPLWSIAFEVVYYALYPGWLWLRRRSWGAAFIGVPAACYALALVPALGFPAAVLLHYPVWIAGAYVAERMVAGGVSARLALAGAVLFVAGAAMHGLVDTFLGAAVAPVLFGTGAVVFCAAIHRRHAAIDVAEFLGIRSYTIYIVHFPLLALMSASVIETQGARPLHGWLAVAGAVACVSFGCLCFEICERHFLHSRFRDESAAA